MQSRRLARSPARTRRNPPAICLWRSDLSRRRHYLDSLSLLPYIYSYTWEASRTGLPLVRPLALEFRRSRVADAPGDEYLFGRELLVARPPRGFDQPVRLFPPGTVVRLGHRPANTRPRPGCRRTAEPDSVPSAAASSSRLRRSCATRPKAVDPLTIEIYPQVVRRSPSIATMESRSPTAGDRPPLGSPRACPLGPVSPSRNPTSATRPACISFASTSTRRQRGCPRRTALVLAAPPDPASGNGHGMPRVACSRSSSTTRRRSTPSTLPWMSRPSAAPRSETGADRIDASGESPQLLARCRISSRPRPALSIEGRQL